MSEDIRQESTASNLKTIVITSLVTVLITVVTTFIGAFSGTWSFDYQFSMQNEHEAKNIASAFYGEIIALKTIVDQQEYKEKLKRKIKKMESTNQPAIFSRRVTKEMYFKVYNNNISKIGLLEEPLPEKIAILYTTAFSILESMGEFYEIDKDKDRLDEIAKNEDKMKRLLEDHKALLYKYYAVDDIIPKVLKAIKDKYKIDIPEKYLNP